MSQPFLYFALPDIGEDEIAEVTAVLRSGWITTGARARQLEDDFATYVGKGSEGPPLHAVAVNSATAGLHLALEAVGIGPGDEVIVPTYTFTATAEVVRYLGAHPVFVDCDPDTLNITAEAIEQAVSKKTKAVIPVHIGGLTCDMTGILDVAKRHNLKVVEDAAHALPATHNGKTIGALASDATVFSFYATKTITTGEGGMVVTADPDIAKRCRIMRLHGMDRDSFDRYTSDKPSWAYEVVAPGFKYNMTDIAAAIGIHQLRRLPSFHAKRGDMAQRFRDALSGLPLIMPAMPPAGDQHAWHLFIVRLTSDAKLNRDDFIRAMTERGIGTSVHFIPLHRQPYWRKTYRLDAKQFPHAENAFKGAVTLPLYTRMTADDEQRVIAAVRDLLG
ncbi:MAG: DegT/DnrJ/EryC1/StrS aminotransferase family protein [Rhodobacteraceae bacterium]|nr:DegT/DnrJ/EryC1/StrS aminotransferase family protein [Paracoccaceae bacterium]